MRRLACLSSSHLITEVKQTCPLPELGLVSNWYTGVTNPANHNILLFQNRCACLVGMLGLCLTDVEGHRGSCHQRSQLKVMISLLPSRKQHRLDGTKWMMMKERKPGTQGNSMHGTRGLSNPGFLSVRASFQHKKVPILFSSLSNS